MMNRDRTCCSSGASRVCAGFVYVRPPIRRARVGRFDREPGTPVAQERDIRGSRSGPHLAPGQPYPSDAVLAWTMRPRSPVCSERPRKAASLWPPGPRFQFRSHRYCAPPSDGKHNRVRRKRELNRREATCATDVDTDRNSGTGRIRDVPGGCCRDLGALSLTSSSVRAWSASTH